MAQRCTYRKFDAHIPSAMVVQCMIRSFLLWIPSFFLSHQNNHTTKIDVKDSKVKCDLKVYDPITFGFIH